MRTKLQRRQYLLRSIFSMWRNWAISIGVLAFLIALSPVLPSRWVPLLALILFLALRYHLRNIRKMKSPPCTRILNIATVSIFISAVIILIALIMLNGNNVYELSGQPVNTSNPSIPILIIAPVTTLVSIYYSIRGNNTSFCRFCTTRNGARPDRGLIGTIYNKESHFQNRMLNIISIGVTLVTWAYYWFYYININYNQSDRYFFTILPIAVYVFSLVYLAIRYYSMWQSYSTDVNLRRLIDHSGTIVRYIVINREQIFLRIPQLTKELLFTEEGKIDVAVKLRLPYRESIPAYKLEQMFREVYGETNAKIKLLYQTNDHSLNNNVFHCAVYVNDPEAISKSINGEWFSLRQIHELKDTQAVAVSLITELKRIYAISMAWKTYDRQGYRLYNIKHYKPTFRLRDLTDWDVDFNDERWIAVAAINQDKPFFRLRRLWKKYINGNGA
jgi:hypothetical protein